MPDVYATIAEADTAVQEKIANILELRAADPQQREMLESYLAAVSFPDGSRVLEIGCGTGPVTRALARRRGVSSVIGLDPSPVMLARARTLAADYSGISFEAGDGRVLQFNGSSFEVVVLHTTLCHVPGPEEVLAEAFRVLTPGGQLVIFDGDYAATSLSIGKHDPLGAVAAAAVDVIAHDPWLIRKLPALVRRAGFELQRARSHAYTAAVDADYTFTLVDRGADALAASDTIGSELATALKNEARRRSKDGRFFGLIAYGSLIAAKPLRAGNAIDTENSRTGAEPS